MLFTVLSKTLFKNANCTRAYLYLFLTGMIGYILLHHHLNSYRRTGLRKTVNKYFYYIISIDFVIGAYYVRCVLNRKRKESSDNKKENQYTKEQQLQIAKNLELAKRLNQRYEEVKRSPFIKPNNTQAINAPIVSTVNNADNNNIQSLHPSPVQTQQQPVQQQPPVNQPVQPVVQPQQQPVEQQVQQPVENQTNNSPELADTEIPVFSGK